MKVTTFMRTSSLLKNRLKKINSLIDACPSTLDSFKIAELNSYSDEAKTKIADFEKTLKRLLETEALEDYNEEQISDIQDEVNSLYISIASKIKTKLPQVTPASDQPSTVSHESVVKLPKLALKSFNGDPLQWLSYINLFHTTIHRNKDLPDVAKFQYLIGTLSDEALTLIRSLPITAENYTVAYNSLREHYHSPRRLISLHLNKILDLPHLNGNSMNNLKEFLNSLNEHTQGLRALEMDIYDKNPLLVVILLRKLDNILRKKFESTRKLDHAMPDVKSIMDFLNSECYHYENAALHSNSSPPSRFHHIQPSNYKRTST